MARRGQGPSPVAAPPAWASVRLVAGESGAGMWRVDSSSSQVQLSVGSQDGCDWQVTAAGVAPIHFEMTWDGRRLWICDTSGAGVTVDGAPVNGWQAITGRVRVEFGSAVMLAESSVPAVAVSDAAIPGRSGGGGSGSGGSGSGSGSGDDDETRILQGTSGMSAPPRALVPSGTARPEPEHRGDPRGVPAHAAPTIIAELEELPSLSGLERLGAHPAPPGGYPTTINPMLYSKPGPVLGSGPGPGPAGMPGPAGASPGGMGPMPGTPPPAGGPMMPGGGFPGSPPLYPGPVPGQDAPRRLQFSLPPRTWALIGLTFAAAVVVLFLRPGAGGKGSASSSARQASATQAQGGAQAVGQGGAGTQPSAGGQQTAGGAAGGAGEQAGGGEQTGGEAAGGEQAGGEQAGGEQAGGEQAGGEQAGGEQAGGEQAGGEQAGGEQAGGEQAGGEQAAGGQQAGGEKAGGEQQAGGEKAGGEQAAGGQQAGGQQAGGEKAGGEQTAGEQTGGEQAGGEQTTGAQADPKEAADLLHAGRQREALAIYTELARQHPDVEAYAAIAKILKRRLDEQCKDAEKEGLPCDSAP